MKDQEKIAKFMGYTKTHPDYWRNDNDNPLQPNEMVGNFKADELEFDTNWNWIMAVADRIESLSLDVDHYTFSVFIGKHSTVIMPKTKLGHPNFDSEIASSDNNLTKKEKTFQVILDFVDWYNKYHKKQKDGRR